LREEKSWVFVMNLNLNLNLKLKKKYTSNTHCLSAFSSRETSNKKIRRSDHPVLTLPSSLEGREELGVRNESEPGPEIEPE
jgi:hypothetical protein